MDSSNTNVPVSTKPGQLQTSRSRISKMPTLRGHISKELISRPPHLEMALLMGAHLERVHLTGAHLEGAYLTRSCASRKRSTSNVPLPGMMLHQDASRYTWLSDGPALDLVVTMDDATSEIYSAFLVEEEGDGFDVPGVVGSIRAARPAVEPVYRSRQSLLSHGGSRRQGGSRPTDAGRARAGASGGRAYRGGFTAGVWHSDPD